MGKVYSQTLSEHRRLTILKYLVETTGYSSNVSILTDVCNGFAVTSTRDEVATDARWLAGKGFATVSDQGDFMIVTIEPSGAEVAKGLRVVDGIKRPGP
ncbi:MAG: hypothetical protein AAGF71_04070 [Pseudomonadota bacterium]